jgi:hypothetical protein
LSRAIIRRHCVGPRPESAGSLVHAASDHL